MTTDEFLPRRAIVTASDSGIGAATALALADGGMDVGITWHRDQQGAEHTAEEVRARGRRAVVVHFDATEFDAVPQIIDELADALGGVDVFVNNAGASTPRPVLEIPMQEWLDTMALNVDGAFLGMQTAARHMVQAGHGGRLIAVTSVHAHQPRVGLGAYISAKHALSWLIKTMAQELGHHGITANAVSPGEIAAVIAFLASLASSYVTGADWSVDGGMLQMGPEAGSLVQDDSWREI